VIDLNGGNKTVSTTTQSLDDTLLTATITYGMPQLLEARIQRRIANELPSPELLQEFGFRDNTITMPQEIG
jgi:hypothetical protein